MSSAASPCHCLPSTTEFRVGSGFTRLSIFNLVRPHDRGALGESGAERGIRMTGGFQIAPARLELDGEIGMHEERRMSFETERESTDMSHLVVKFVWRELDGDLLHREPEGPAPARHLTEACESRAAR